MSRAIDIVIVLTILWLAPRQASATAVSLLGVDPAKKDIASVSLTGYWNGLSIYGGGGEWRWQDATPPGYNPTFFAYTADMMKTVTRADNVAIRSTNLLTVSGVPNAGGKGAAWMFNTYAPSMHVSGAWIDAAALQVAIWEALYDASVDLWQDSVRVSASTAVATKAVQYLTALYSGGAPGANRSSQAT